MTSSVCISALLAPNHAGVSWHWVANEITWSRSSYAICTRPLSDTSGLYSHMCIDCYLLNPVQHHNRRKPVRQLYQTQVQCRLSCHPLIELDY